MPTEEDVIHSSNLPSPLIPDNISSRRYLQKKSRRRVSSITTISSRLYQRRQLHVRRKIISDLSLGFGILGIIFMIINEEIIFSNLQQNLKFHSLIMTFLDILTTISTIILLTLIISYHITDIRVYMIDNSLVDFRIALSFTRLAQLFIELLVCGIHPIHHSPFSDNNFFREGDILGLLMFLRFYLLGRALVMHSWINQTFWVQSLGTMNRINFNLGFVIKSAMNIHPVKTIIIMSLIFFFWSSWALRVCEIRNVNGIWMFLNSMWLIAITFLGVGYGDIVPVTNCGKIIAIITGVFGCAITALTVAVLARKLELSSSESFLHYFVMNSQINKVLKSAAANVLQKAWILYKTKTLQKGSNMSCCSHKSSLLYSEKQLYKAIYDIREIKQQFRKLNEESKMSSSSIELNENLQNDILEIKNRMSNFEMALSKLNDNIKLMIESKDKK